MNCILQVTSFEIKKDKKQFKFLIEIVSQNQFFNYNFLAIKNEQISDEICYQPTSKRRGLKLYSITKSHQFDLSQQNYIQKSIFIRLVIDSIRQSGNISLGQFSDEIFAQIPRIENQSLNLLSLRGGGCGASKLEQTIVNKQQESLTLRKLPSYFIGDLVKYLDLIINSAQLSSDEQQREQILMAIQWFTVMREHFNTLCVNSQSAASVYDLIFSYVPKLLKSTVTYVRISGFLCIQILQIINDLFRILFTFFMQNNKRFLKVEDKEYFDELISDFETHLHIEASNIWMAGAEFEITMIKAVIQSSPSNSDEGQKLLVQFLGGLVQSVLTMSPTDDLIDSLIGGAKFLYQAHQVEDLKKKYEVYYYFESLKWYMIQLLREYASPKRVIQLLKSAFTNYIENSNDWLLNFCWVKLIASLISYRPIITKSEISINKVEQQQRWNQLIKLKYLSQVSFNKDLGRLFFYQNNQNSEVQVMNQLMQKLGFKSFQSFNDSLLKSLEYSSINQFSFKEKGQYEQIQIDYLYDIIFGNYQLEESIEQLTQLHLGYEKLFQRSKKCYEKFSEIIKNEKEKQLQIEEIKLNTKELTVQSFCIFNYCSNVYKNFVLYFERFQIILNSAIIENSDQEQLKQLYLGEIPKIEQDFSERCNQALVQLLNERKQLIISLTTLEIYFENFGKLQHQDQQITQQFQYIESFINSSKNVKSQYIKIIEKINKSKLFSSKYKKKSICQYKQEGSLKVLQQLARKMINLNDFQSQFITISELLQATSNQGGSINKLIVYNSLRYFLVDFINQINLQKDQLEEIIKFIQKNLSSLQVQGSSSVISINEIRINNLDLVNDMLRKQLKILQTFFSQEEKQSGSSNTKDSISGEQILQYLKKDSEQLQNMQAQQHDDQNLKSICYAVAMVEQFFDIYLRNPQKLSLISEQIFKIYSQLNLKQDGLYEDQALQYQNEKQRENLALNKNLENFKTSLMNLFNIISSTLPKCQITLECIVDKVALYENISLIEMKLDYQNNKETLSFDYEVIDNQNLLENMASISEIQMSFNELNVDFNLTIYQGSLCAGLFQIQLNFCDLIRPNFSKSINMDQNIFQKAQTFLQEFVDDVKEGLEDQNYKTRQCYVVSLISVQSSSQEQYIMKFCQDSILKIWAYEKDERVKALLKNKELQEMQKSLFSSDLKSFSKRLQADMNEKLSKIADFEQKIYFEGDSQVRQQMHEELLIEQQEFEDYLDNINDMAGKLDIGIQFLKDIKKNLTQLKQKIDKLQDAVNDIGDDIKKLRGKNFNELLNIRKRKVLEQMQLNSLSKIYIPLKCQEWDPISSKQIGNPSILLHSNFQNQEGEINEFLLKDSSNKDVLLLRGIAGSGKSRAAGKIEEFLWQKIDSKESSWIPIYVSLPTLKEPKFNLIDQALESDFYQFDKIQVKEIKEALAQQGLKIILILDSYDEMKQDCIESNLYQTNRFQQDLFGNLQDSKQVKEQLKVIITTRTEVLTSNNYQTWFYGEALESLKEVELLGFDEDQQHRYLEEYTLLTLKKEFFELYSFTKQITKQRIEIQEFSSFWNKISDYLMKNQNNLDSQENQFINQKQSRQIISILKLDKIFEKIQKEQILNLEKTMMDLWGTSKFESLIVNAQIQHILTTPFMMEIVVQVLPTMAKQFSGESSFKEKFINNYVKIKYESQKEQKQIIEQENKRLIILGQQVLQQEVEDFTETDFQIKGLKIWDQLQKEKCLQKFSLIDKIQKKDLSKIDDSAIVIKALMFKKLTVFDFYSTFVEFYHSRQITKLSLLGRMINYESLMTDLFNFSQSLAINLTINQLTQIKYIQKGQLTLQFIQKQENQEEDWLDAYFNDFIANGEYKKLIRSCILLTTKGYYYSFTHKSIQEFYVGHFLLKILDDLKFIKEEEFQISLSTVNWENTYTAVKQKQDNSICLNNVEQFCLLISHSLLNNDKFNLSSDNYKGVLSIIREEIKQKLNLKPKLLQILKLSSISQEFIRASSNSLFLLGYNNDLLALQQLQNLRISNIDLDGVSFYGSDLSKSVFQDVSIRSCNFNNVNLTDAKWNGIKCDELHGLVGHQNSIDYIQFSHNGKDLISISMMDKSLRFWDIQQGKEIQQYSFSFFTQLNQFYCMPECYKLQQAIFSNNDQILGLLWCLSEGDMNGYIICYAVQIFDLKSDKSLGFSQQDDKQVHGMKFSYNNTILAFCIKERNIITLLSLSENKEYTLSGHSEQVNSILFTEDDQILISCSDDKSIKFWNYKEKTIIHEFQGHNSSVQTIALQPKGHILASCSKTIIKLWNIQTYQLLFTSDDQNQRVNIQDLKFLSDGQTLIYWGYTKFLIWSMKDFKQIRFIEQNSNCVCFSSDDKLLAQLSKNEIQLWDIEAGKLISFIGGQSKQLLQMCFQPGSLVLSTVRSNENVIRLWNAKIEKNTNQLEGHKQKVMFTGFSPDNKIIYSASTDETIRLWDVQDGKHLQYISNIKGCKRIEFSKKGEFIFIEANQTYLWYFKEGRLIQLKDEEIVKTTINTFTIQTNGSILGWSSYESQRKESKIYLYDLIEKKVKATLIALQQIKELKFSPNGQLLASMSFNSKAELWDTKSYSSIVTLDQVDKVFFSPNNQVICIFSLKEQHYGLLNYEGVQIGCIKNQTNIKFSPNGLILASNFQKTLSIWDSSNGKQIATLDGHQNDINSFSFSPDGSFIATQSYEKYIYLWDVSNLKFFRKLELLDPNFGSFAFSKNNNILATFGGHQSIIIWNYKDGTQIASLKAENQDYIQFLLFSHNDQILVSSNQNNYIIIWDANTWKKINSIQSESCYTDYIQQSIQFSPDSQKIAVFGHNTILILNQAQSNEPTQLLGHQERVKKIEFLSDCTQLISLSEEGKCLVFWDCEKQQLKNILAGANVEKKQLILSIDEKKIASYVGDGKIRLYETEFGLQVATFQGHKHLISYIQFSPDSSYLASCSLDHTIILWDVNQLKQYAVLEGHKQIVEKILFSPNSYLLSSICSKTLRIWEIKSLKQISTIDISKFEVSQMDILFSPDSKQLVLFSHDELKIWNLIESSEPVVMQKISNLRIFGFSPDGILCISSDYYQIQMWDIKEYKLQFQIKTVKQNNLQFNLEGNLIFLIGESNNVVIYDMKRNKQIASIQEHTNCINQIALSTDNKVFASCSDDSTIKLFYIQEYKSQKNLSSYKTLANYAPITVQGCQIQRAEIYSKIGWNLKELFIQNGANKK